LRGLDVSQPDVVDEPQRCNFSVVSIELFQMSL
jgi:hypothetical protein